MRIESKYKDYYDGLQRMDLEPIPVYRRHENIINSTKEDFKKITDIYWYRCIRNDEYDIKFSLGFLGFCGNIYPFVEVIDYRVKEKNPMVIAEISGRYTGRTYIFTLDEMDRFASSIKCESYQKEYHRVVKRRSVWNMGGSRQRVEDFFSLMKGKDLGYLFDKHGPIFVYEEKQIIEHPLLSNYGFAKVVQPYDAYQTLRMYLDNQAEPRKPIPAIPDDILVEIKGFDKRFSFRKDKAVKK